MSNIWCISSVRDLQTWANNAFDVDDAQAARIARLIWTREDFPHPVNNTDLTDYLEELNWTEIEEETADA